MFWAQLAKSTCAYFSVMDETAVCLTDSATNVVDSPILTEQAMVVFVVNVSNRPFMSIRADLLFQMQESLAHQTTHHTLHRRSRTLL